jgi:hypothetical protein
LLPGSLKRTADWLKHTNFFELNSMQLAITLHSCTMSEMARFVLNTRPFGCELFDVVPLASARTHTHTHTHTQVRTRE